MLSRCSALVSLSRPSTVTPVERSAAATSSLVVPGLPVMTSFAPPARRTPAEDGGLRLDMDAHADGHPGEGLRALELVAQACSSRMWRSAHQILRQPISTSGSLAELEQWDCSCVPPFV